MMFPFLLLLAFAFLPQIILSSPVAQRKANTATDKRASVSSNNRCRKAPKITFPSVKGLVPNEYILSLKHTANVKNLSSLIQELPKCSQVANTVKYTINDPQSKLLIATLDDNAYSVLNTSTEVSRISPGQNGVDEKQWEISSDINTVKKGSTQQAHSTNTSITSKHQRQFTLFMPTAPWWLSRIAGRQKLGRKDATEDVPVNQWDQSHIWKFSRRSGWEGDGQGVVIYVVDSGINKVDWVRRLSPHSILPGGIPEEDLSGHGTAVAGIISGGRRAYRGVGQSATIVSVKITTTKDGPTGEIESDFARVVAAMSLIKENWKERKASKKYTHAIINMSSFPLNTAEMRQAVMENVEAGIFVVLSTPNKLEQRGYLRFPRGTTGIFQVAGTDIEDNPTISANADVVNIRAPGKHIYVNLVKGSEFEKDVIKKNAIIEEYHTFANGNSFAAPMISGLLAIHLQRNPSQTYEQAYKSFLKTTTGSANIPMFPEGLAGREAPP